MLAVEASQKNGHELEPTSCDSVRHSFILVNPELARTLVSCRTCFPFMFPTHPVLRAVFDAGLPCHADPKMDAPQEF